MAPRAEDGFNLTLEAKSSPTGYGDAQAAMRALQAFEAAAASSPEELRKAIDNREALVKLAGSSPEERALKRADEVLNSGAYDTLLRASQGALRVVEGSELQRLPQKIIRKALAVCCASEMWELLENEKLRTRVKELEAQNLESSRAYLSELSLLRSQARAASASAEQGGLDEKNWSFSGSDRYYWDALMVIPENWRAMVADVIVEKLKCFCTMSEGARMSELQTVLRKCASALQNNGRAELTDQLSSALERADNLERKLLAQEEQCKSLRKSEIRLEHDIRGAEFEIQRKEADLEAMQEKLVRFESARDRRATRRASYTGMDMAALIEVVQEADSDLDDDSDNDCPRCNALQEALQGKTTDCREKEMELAHQRCCFEQALKTERERVQKLETSLASTLEAVLSSEKRCTELEEQLRSSEAERQAASEMRDEINRLLQDLDDVRSDAEVTAQLHEAAKTDAAEAEKRALEAELVADKAKRDRQEMKAEMERVQAEARHRFHPSRFAALQAEMRKTKQEYEATKNANEALRGTVESFWQRLLEAGADIEPGEEERLRLFLDNCKRTIFNRLHEDAIRRAAQEYRAPENDQEAIELQSRRSVARPEWKEGRLRQTHNFLLSGGAATLPALSEWILAEAASELSGAQSEDENDRQSEPELPPAKASEMETTTAETTPETSRCASSEMSLQATLKSLPSELEEAAPAPAAPTPPVVPTPPAVPKERQKVTLPLQRRSHEMYEQEYEAFRSTKPPDSPDLQPDSPSFALPHSPSFSSSCPVSPALPSAAIAAGSAGAAVAAVKEVGGGTPRRLLQQESGGCTPRRGVQQVIDEGGTTPRRSAMQQVIYDTRSMQLENAKAAAKVYLHEERLFSQPIDEDAAQDIGSPSSRTHRSMRRHDTDVLPTAPAPSPPPPRAPDGDEADSPRSPLRQARQKAVTVAAVPSSDHAGAASSSPTPKAAPLRLPLASRSRPEEACKDAAAETPRSRPNAAGTPTSIAALVSKQGPAAAAVSGGSTSGHAVGTPKASRSRPEEACKDAAAETPRSRPNAAGTPTSIAALVSKQGPAAAAVSGGSTSGHAVGTPKARTRSTSANRVAASSLSVQRQAQGGGGSTPTGGTVAAILAAAEAEAARLGEGPAAASTIPVRPNSAARGPRRPTASIRREDHSEGPAAPRALEITAASPRRAHHHVSSASGSQPCSPTGQQRPKSAIMRKPVLGKPGGGETPTRASRYQALRN
eukprot:TRINITY_DN18654_c1_g5_i1.p1 TRINITY_DN18654_c1_g5~~TRINITY_DN18654_c1_g5_i1.p1  ORF type:complete len:1232 (+),score=285.54 TRINITY_DN18654_c1_g5_i1:255-3950(+)